MAYEENSVLNCVSGHAIQLALIHAMDKVDAVANGVALNNTDAHCGVCGMKIGELWIELVVMQSKVWNVLNSSMDVQAMSCKCLE